MRRQTIKLSFLLLSQKCVLISFLLADTMSKEIKAPFK